MSSFLSLFAVSDAAATRAADPARAAGSRAALPVRGAQPDLESAFASASQATGLPFDFFMTTAMRESSLDVNAAATTSSARGPFQFIEQTWLAMVHDHGPSLGLSEEAAAIERLANGRFAVDNPQTRDHVLAMRHDAELSAIMSGLYLQENAEDLQNALGRPVSVGEGYVAHVFGPAGASRLISLAEQQPNRVAAQVFPTQAQANRGLFYDRSGAPVSVRELYDRLTDGFPQALVPGGGAQVAGQVAGQAGVQVASAQARDPSLPIDLEPAGFDALREAVAPDQLARMGLFSATDRTGVPFFAALYNPEGIAEPEVGEAFVSTHGEAPTGLGETRRSGLEDAWRAGALGPPVDLLGLAQGGQLVRTYANPAAQRAGLDLVPPV